MTINELEKATEIYRKISELEKEIKCLQQDLEIKADNAEIIFPCTRITISNPIEISDLITYYLGEKRAHLNYLKKQFEAL
jgi:hypothetical protein